MHIHWLMTYHSHDNESHYHATIYNQNPYKQLDFVERDRSRYNVWMVLQGRLLGVNGMNYRTLSLGDRVYVTFHWLIITLDSFWSEVTGIFIMMWLRPRGVQLAPCLEVQACKAPEGPPRRAVRAAGSLRPAGRGGVGGRRMRAVHGGRGARRLMQTVGDGTVCKHHPRAL